MANANWPPSGTGGGGGVVNGAVNVGTGVGVFQLLSGTTLQFRSIDNGTGISWVQGVTDLVPTITLAPFSTTDLAEGTNLYFTNARFDARFATDFAAETTTNLAEGTNLYFTTARARLSISGTAPVSYNNATGVISMHVADATNDGYLSSVDWNTFNNKQNTLTLGDLTDVGTDGITVTGGTGAVVGAGTSISQHVADATHNGYLSSADFVSFSSTAPTIVSSISSNTTLVNNHIYLVDTAASRVLTLPAAVSGLRIWIKDSTGGATLNPMALTPPGAETIDTVAGAYSLDYSLGSWEVTSDGTNYFII